MNPSNHHSDRHEEELVRRVLEAVGPRHALPGELRERWEAMFREEFARTVKRRRVKRSVLSAIAASVAAVAIAVGFLGSPVQPVPPVAHAVAVHGYSELVGAGAVTEGMTVAARQSIETGPRSHVSLRYHQADVRLGAGSTVEFYDDRLVLFDGALYVDTGAGPVIHQPVVIETEFGTISHIGTQFMVEVHDAALTAAVREGTMVLSTDDASDAFSAENGQAKLVSISGVGDVDAIGPAEFFIQLRNLFFFLRSCQHRSLTPCRRSGSPGRRSPGTSEFFRPPCS